MQTSLAHTWAPPAVWPPSLLPALQRLELVNQGSMDGGKGQGLVAAARAVQNHHSLQELDQVVQRHGPAFTAGGCSMDVQSVHGGWRPSQARACTGRAHPLPLGLALPQEPRLRRLCEALLDEPLRHPDWAGWAQEAGASERTVARLFRQELGTTFAAWRQQVLLAKALALAARKRPMALIAAELGYASASAFTAMVRRSVGQPPRRFFNSA
jgi:AraC-like DNA-binding protein